MSTLLLHNMVISVHVFSYFQKKIFEKEILIKMIAKKTREMSSLFLEDLLQNGDVTLSLG